MDQRNRTLLKVGLLSNIFEWYEFSVFGFLAGLIGQLFFESSEPIIGLMRGFMLFAMSYLARPLGGLCFGLIGDRIGNGTVLRLSLMLMSIPTILIGLLPTYKQIGITATLCLTLLRLIQGFAAGGELPNSGCYIFDQSKSQSRSLLCSAVVVSAPIGMLIGSGVAGLLLQCFDQTTLLAWAWRIPFLFGIPLTLFIGLMRKSIQNPLPPKTKTNPPYRWYQLIQPFLKAIALGSLDSVGFYLFFLWMPSYLHHFLGVTTSRANFLNSLGLLIGIPLYGLGGYCARRWGYHNVIKFGIVSMLLLIPPLFYSFQRPLPWETLCMLHSIAVVLHVPMQSVFAEMIFSLFPSTHRNLGVIGLAWSIPAAFIGSTTPAICTYVIHKTGWLMFPAFYIMFFGLLALPVALCLKAPSKIPT